MKPETLTLKKFETFEVANTNSIKGGFVYSEIDCATFNDVDYNNGFSGQGEGWDVVGSQQDECDIIQRNGQIQIFNKTAINSTVSKNSKISPSIKVLRGSIKRF